MKNEHYGPVTADLLKSLESIVGQAGLVTGAAMVDYARDEAPGLAPVPPDVVVKPADTPSVAGVLRVASEHRVPVVPRGAGTGLSGGAVPIYGGIVLSLERMNRVLEIDTDNFTATVEPGVVLSELHRSVEGRGLYYPLYPGEMSATIGGNVATNAGGMRAVRYGVTRSFVLGLEAVLPTGEIIETGGKYVKCSTGYDLTQLIVGSEGTLAVITRVILRLIPPPGMRAIVLAPFDNLQRAVEAVPHVLKDKILPVGIEFVEKDVVNLTERFRGIDTPVHNYEASLMIIVEADDEAGIDTTCARVGEICMNHGAVDVFVATGDRAKDLMQFREKAWPAIAQTGRAEMADVVVPRSRIADFVARAREASRELGITTYMVGHAGDGNVHLMPMRPSDKPDPDKMSKVFKTYFDLGASMGGAISGEHGIGYAKKPYLEAIVAPAKLELWRRIKKAFDPDNIMNPGKIFDIG